MVNLMSMVTVMTLFMIRQRTFQVEQLKRKLNFMGEHTI